MFLNVTGALKSKITCVRFELLMVKKIHIAFWVVTLCSLAMFWKGMCFDLHFCCEDGGRMFFRCVGIILIKMNCLIMQKTASVCSFGLVHF